MYGDFETSDLKSILDVRVPARLNRVSHLTPHSSFGWTTAITSQDCSLTSPAS